MTALFLHYVKKNSECGMFMRFYAYICHAIDGFACFVLQH